MLPSGLANTTFLTILLWSGLPFLSRGSIIKPEDSAMYAVAFAIGMYEREHDGGLPKGWDDLVGILDFEELNKPLMGRGTAPIQDRYQFLAQPLPYQVYGRTEECRVLLMRTIPLMNRKSEKQWRTIIYRCADGGIATGTVSEIEAIEMLRKAGIVLAPKSHLPAVDYDEYLPGMDPNLNNDNEGPRPIFPPGTGPVTIRGGTPVGDSPSEARHPHRSPGAVDASASGTGTTSGSWPVILVTVVGALGAGLLVYRTLKR